ncbi:hypothetical protein MTIN_25640 [Moorella thermoacetica]|nr:hypothetical protein MTIN_25640 [Moorella thermoacetica]
MMLYILNKKLHKDLKKDKNTWLLFNRIIVFSVLLYLPVILYCSRTITFMVFIYLAFLLASFCITLAAQNNIFNIIYILLVGIITRLIPVLIIIAF